MATPNTISGKYLTTEIGDVVLAGTHEWGATENADKLEGTDGSHNGRGRKYAGVIDTTFKIRFYLNILNGDAALVRSGTVLTNLALFLDGAATSPMYLISSATVFTFNVVGRVRDTFVVDVDIEANGDVITFTDPN